MRSSIQEIEFQAEGEIVYTTFGNRGRPTQEKSYIHKRQFAVVRKGPQWKIRTTTQNDYVQYEETGCDGVRIYSLCQMNEEKTQREQGPLPPDCRTALGGVRYGKFPVGMDSDLVFPLWLAFCSSDYFHQIKGNRIVAPEFIEGDSHLKKAAPVSCFRPAVWQLNKSFLASKVEWRPEGREFGFSPPFDGEFLSAIFEASGWGEFSGATLPTSFELKTYFPNKLQVHPDPTQGELCLSWIVEAKVHSLRNLSNFSCLPALTKKALITDGRYRGNRCPDGWLSYSSSAWMTEDEVEAKNEQHGVTCEKQIPQD